MKLELEFDIKPLSLNQAFLNMQGKGRVKSPAYREFEAAILEQLHPKRNIMKAWAYQVATLDHPCIVRSLEVSLENMFTKKAQINLRAGDIDDMIKCAQDVVFKQLKIDFKGIEDAQVVMGMEDKWEGKNGFTLTLKAMELLEYANKQGFEPRREWLA